MNQPDENAEITENDKTGNQQATIFDESGNQTKYERQVKQARYWLFMLAGYWGVYGFAQFNKVQELNTYLLVKRNAWYVLAIYIVISLVFLTVAFWSYKKASLAFLAAILFHIGIATWQISINGFHFQENIVRIVIMVVLLKGYKDARSYEELAKTFGDQRYRQEV